MRRFLAILKKEFRQIARDPLSLGMLVLLPAVLLILYGYALSFDVKHIRVAVLDHDRTPESRALQDALFRNPYFDRAGALSRPGEADELLDRGLVRAVLVVPEGYAAALLRRERVAVQVLVDGANANTATTTLGYFDALTERITRGLAEAAPAGARRAPRVAPEPRVWFNPELQSARFLVPGLMGILLMLSTVVATSLSLVREKERQTMEQIVCSPARRHEIILGKTVPYVFICLFTVAIILLMGYFLFGVAIRGSMALLAATILIFLLAGLGLGVLISSVTNSQQMAFQIASIATILPSIVLSGFIFPLQSMPVPIQWISVLVVPRYFVSALRRVILRGAPLSVVWPDLAGMVVIGLVFYALAGLRIRAYPETYDEP
jgi:ABC-2 type transport system permease protein